MTIIFTLITLLLTAAAGFITVAAHHDRKAPHGYRRAAAHDHDRTTVRTGPLSGPLAAPTQGNAAGDASDPRTGTSPGMSLDPAAKAPDGIEPVTGWRCWGYNNGYLTSVNDALIWPAREAFVAECTKGFIRTEPSAEPSHEAPVEGCTCGLYAAGAEDACQWTQRRGQVVVWGIVSGWGRVIEHNRGWKAQYAYPSKLFIWDEDVKKAGKAALLLSKRYGCEVSIASSKEAERAGVPGAHPAHRLHTTSGVNSPASVSQWHANRQLTSAPAATWQHQMLSYANATPAPAINPNFQAFASAAAYQEFVEAEAKKALAQAQAEAHAKAQQAARSLLDAGLILPATTGVELGFDDEFPTTPAQAAQAELALNPPSPHEIEQAARAFIRAYKDRPPPRGATLNAFTSDEMIDFLKDSDEP